VTRGAAFGAILCAFLFLLLTGDVRADPSRFIPWKEPAAPSLALNDLAGRSHTLDDYRGNVVLVNFWATWCEPCRDEYPMLNDLAKEYGPKGLQVVGVNFNDDGDLILMRRFIARYKPVFPNYRKQHGDESGFQSVVSPDWNGLLPASFFYDKDGRQVGHVFGASTRETYEAAIRQLLSGGGSSASR